MEYIIRDYNNEDFDSLMNLWVLTGLGNPARGDDQTVIKQTLDQGGKMLIMEDKRTKSFIGCSWLTNDGRRIYLHHFGIHPNYQGKGLSKPLLHESLQYAKKLNMQIKLEVHNDNKIAASLYLNQGFTYLGDYNVYIIRDINSIP